jgi:RNA polymerase sigma-70 factor (ECF subfamily)
MEPEPETRGSLIVRLHNAGDERAWGEFLELYQPLVLRLMRRGGLQESDAQDVCQQVLAAVARDVGQWNSDGQQASFRRWLFRIAKHQTIKFMVKARSGRGAGGTDAMVLLAAQPDAAASLSVAFDHEHRQQLLRWGVEQIRGEFRELTWSAFWRTCVLGQPVAEVAAELGTTAGNVYVARSRVIARLREKVAQKVAEVEA